MPAAHTLPAVTPASERCDVPPIRGDAYGGHLRSRLMIEQYPEHISAIIARVLNTVERVQRGLYNATAGVHSTNVTIPRAVVKLHSENLAGACDELRSVDGPLKRAVPGSMKARVLHAAWREDVHGFECAHCHSIGQDMHVDHITPLARGGSNDRENLQVLCATCNLKKGSKTT